VQVGGLHFFHQITGINFSLPDDRKNAELQHTFAHLTLGILNVHTINFFLIKKVADS
jgi:hypothetical protein